MESNQDDKVLCCLLCGSEEYFLSEADSMLCAQCGAFFEDIKQVVVTQPIVTSKLDNYAITKLVI
ncbi:MULTISPECIES: hypothetical protein [Vibrio]|nr:MULTISPECIES: hypothetical protein [Vibrio]USD35322.1 hypothetical protein J8Z27_18760 [Vibrio sp. SCSIO 43186]USD48479.1 hypothetical protein J4N38_19155 [Vibrio sp. SCSIO 43145]USD72447.1 hypothetical protein J4N41_18770 [Vibrio sp. SCSIO 43139]USD98808.1 hypothetical protein CTT30_18960 [Vibrio coralliilyticus]